MARVLVLFVDALGPRQLEAFGSRLDFAPHRGELEGVLGYSSGALASLLTGEPPAAHGRMCLFAHRGVEPSLLAPLRWLGLLPRVIHERGFLRRRLARALATWRGLTGYVALHRVPPEAFSWLDLPERDDLFTTHAIQGAPTFLARAREADLRVYASPWQLPEDERLAEAAQRIAAERPDLAFVYATALDGALHRHGNRGPEVSATRQKLAAQLARVLEAMGADARVLLVGDHGMADVERVVDPRPVAGGRCFVDSTMLRVWGTDEELAETRRRVEAALPGRWLDHHDLVERDAPTHRYGDAIFVLPEGAIFAPSYVGGRAAGMHGYDRTSPSARAAIASDQPLPPVRRLEDVGAAVIELLGVAA